MLSPSQKKTSGAAAETAFAPQVARRFARGEGLLGQAHRELALEAKHELDARETIEPELALERAVERYVGLDVGPSLACHRGDEREHAVRIDLLGNGLGDRLIHGASRVYILG